MRASICVSLTSFVVALLNVVATPVWANSGAQPAADGAEAIDMNEVFTEIGLSAHELERFEGRFKNAHINIKDLVRDFVKLGYKPTVRALLKETKKGRSIIKIDFEKGGFVYGKLIGARRQTQKGETRHVLRFAHLVAPEQSRSDLVSHERRRANSQDSVMLSARRSAAQGGTSEHAEKPVITDVKMAIHYGKRPADRPYSNAPSRIASNFLKQKGLSEPLAIRVFPSHAVRGLFGQQSPVHYNNMISKQSRPPKGAPGRIRTSYSEPHR